MPNLFPMVTFLFAGDGSLASDGLSAFLQTKSELKLISECRDGASAIAEIAVHSPQLAVLDAQLPDMSAMEIVRAVRATNQQIRIVVLGVSADRQVADALMAAGSDAYVVRTGPSRHLNDAVRTVRSGRQYRSPLVGEKQTIQGKSPDPMKQDDEVLNLRSAVELQARTVARLEEAIARAQCAIEHLQERVDHLSNASRPHGPAPGDGVPEEAQRRSGLRASLTTVAAGLVMGVLGFQLAGILRPPPDSPIAEFSSWGSEDALKAGPSESLHLAGWESETVANALSLFKTQQYAAAEKLCRSLLKQNPANLAAMKVLASSLFHQNRVDETADVVRSMAVPTVPQHQASLSSRFQFNQ